VVPGTQSTTSVVPGTLPSGQTQSSGSPAVSPAQQAGVGQGSGGLPFTGADIASLSGLGLAMVGCGAVLVLVRRRRTSASASPPV